MAAKIVTVTLVASKERIDGLCPECWKPALHRISGHVLTHRGVGDVTPRTRCRDCGWQTKG